MVITRALVLATLVALQPPRDVPTESDGTASIAGVVMSADVAKQPLRHATVTLRSGVLVSPRITETDDDGRFLFGALGPGLYSLDATKPAYVGMNYGATRPRRLGTSIRLADAQAVTNISIALPRGAVVTGTVVDSKGRPVASATINTLRWLMTNGERRLVAMGTAGQTDDRGQYRLYGLEAGDYLVVIQQDAPRGPSSIVQLGDSDVDRALQDARQGNARTNQPAAPASGPPAVGTAPIYYPGTGDSANATVLHLAAAEERTGVDIRLQWVPVARLSGKVTDPGGRPAAGTTAALMPLGAPVTDTTVAPGGRLGPRALDPNGGFLFTGVPPGEYSVTVSSRPASGGRGSPPVEASPLSAYVTVTVNGVDRDVALTLGPGLAMSGRVAFDGGAAPSSLAGAKVTLQDRHIYQPGYDTAHTADVQSDGTFLITGLTPSHYVLTATPPGGASSPWAVASIAAGGRELLDSPLTIVADGSLTDAVVTFTTRPTSLSGALQTSTGAPTSDYFIVVFPIDRAFWFPSSRRVTAVRPDSAGHYNAGNLPAGEYFVAAVTDIEPGEWFDPAFLDALAATNPIRLTLHEHEATAQDLRVDR